MRVVSGGQTGVDRAALDVALRFGIPCGGWCPAGRWAEDGPVPLRYPLQETPSADPAQRTAWNVRDSDGTLVLLRGPARGGTLTTIRLARRLGRPLFVADLEHGPWPRTVAAWVRSTGIRTLNVAGPRQSESPGIYRQARAFVAALFSLTGWDHRRCGR
jgi:hypothetical protein